MKIAELLAELDQTLQEPFRLSRDGRRLEVVFDKEDPARRLLAGLARLQVELQADSPERKIRYDAKSSLFLRLRGPSWQAAQLSPTVVQIRSADMYDTAGWLEFSLRVHMPPTLISDEELADKLKRHAAYLAGQSGASPADLSYHDLTGRRFGKCDLRGANFRGAVVRAADFTDADLSYADLTAADGSHADFTRANMTLAAMPHMRARQAVFYRANLRNARLSLADLTSADLREVSLEHAILTFATLAGANLSCANLASSRCSGADFSHASLSRINLAGVAGMNPADWLICRIDFGGWSVCITATETTIGCQTHGNSYWLALESDSPALYAMHPLADSWWQLHGATVKAAIRCVLAKAEKLKETQACSGQ